jgi:hypothetical protein
LRKRGELIGQAMGVKACLKNINTPNFGSVFRHTALKCLAIHKVLLRHFALSDEKCPLIGHIAVFQTAPR